MAEEFKNYKKAFTTTEKGSPSSQAFDRYYQFSQSAYLTSSNTKLMNLNESRRVKMISATGTPRFVKGRINHCKANASCSDVVVVRQRLALWKIFQGKINKKRGLIRHMWHKIERAEYRNLNEYFNLVQTAK